MKKSIFKMPAFAALAIVIAFTFYGCEKLKNPFEGLKLVLDGGALVSPPSTFYVLNAETGLPDPAFNNLEVTITGPNAANLYNSAGKKEFKIVNGVIQTSFSMIPPSGQGADTIYGEVQNITEATPWKYNIIIKAPGYREMVYPVIATNPYPTVHEINLLKESSFIIINFINNTIGTSDNNGKIISRANTNDANLVDFNLSPGQILTDESGSPMSGSVLLKGNYSYYGSGTSFNKIYMQNFNMTENTIQDKNGVILPETNIFPLLSYNLNATVNGKEVYKIAPNSATDTNLTSYFDFQFYYNVETKQNFKAGDSVTLISKRNGSNIWVKEKNIAVNDNNTLTIKIFATHPGTYALVKLSKPVYVDVSFGGNESAPKLYATLNGTIDYFKPDGSVFFSEKIRGTSLSPDGAYIRLPVKPHMPMKLRDVIYSVNESENGNLLTKFKYENPMTNAIIPTASSKITVPYSADNITYFKNGNKLTYGKSVNGKFRGACTGGGSKYVVLPLFYPIYYIEESKAETTPLYQWKSFEASVDVDNQWNFGAIHLAGETTGVPYRFYTIYNNKEFKKIGTLANTAGNNIPDIEFADLPCSQ